MIQTLLSTAENISQLDNSFDKNSTNHLDMDRLSVLDIIFREFHTDMSPQKAAKSLMLSVRQLERITMKYYNMSFKQKYILSRMELAPALLKNFKNMSIDEIAQKLNFNSPQYFAIVFKKYYGISPTEYRKITISK